MVMRGSMSGGRVVRVGKLGKRGDVVKAISGEKAVWDFDEPFWHLDDGHVFYGAAGGQVLEVPICGDSCLRPLRNDDGQDEMLRIAGLPNKETKPAAH